ncbi:hypothetical protein FNO01nite_28290 [Flavobacterium noncentrifugens]|uniref:CheY chemotaxis protein or a CheY-like REC (Receiver) domain n=2 Tax=Flavobacterium noncentrifugens TaxID=1128970 RepID=A0A1G9CU66_9FLAO|nr:hypothetical protein FNO01nite_28290 [Flavobacterium noncentrifugens]SDK55251.1 CheY chemotaxis protein or a CheY-like REC (receiver) domain [Flavobacterium noncentrifugens]
MFNTPKIMYKGSTNAPLPITLLYASDNAVAQGDFRAAVDNMSGNFKSAPLTAEYLVSKQQPPPGTIIFVDCYYSNFTGYQIIQFLKKSKLFFKIPIVVLSKINDYRTQETCWLLGADFYTVQPDSLQEFALLLECLVKLDWPTRKRDKKEFIYSLKNKITA